MTDTPVPIDDLAMNPPPGWFMFGTHVDIPGRVEFHGVDADGMPLWERPVLDTADLIRESDNADHLDRDQLLELTGRMRAQLARGRDWQFGWAGFFDNGTEFSWGECSSREEAAREVRRRQAEEDAADVPDSGRLTFRLRSRLEVESALWRVHDEGV